MRSRGFQTFACWAALVLLHACASTASPSNAPDERASQVEPSTEELRREEELRVIEVGEGNELVVVLLHGYGAAGDDLVQLGRTLHRAVPNARFIMPAAPISMGRGRRWFARRAEGARPAELERSVNALHELIVRLENEGVDRSRLWLGGFSQGAMLTLEMARREQKFAGLFVLSGGTLPNWSSTWQNELPPTRVLIAHGRQDSMLPFSGAQELMGAFSARGAVVRWLPFEGAHTIPPSAVDAMSEMLRSPPQSLP